MKDKQILSQQKGSVAVANSKKKKRRVLIIVLVIVVILAGVIATSVRNMTKQVEMVSNLVQIEAVQKRDLSDTISLKGSIAGVSRTNVISKAASEIKSVHVQVGDIVKEGDLLCILDTTSIKEKIADLEKSMANAQAIDNINNKQAKDAVDQAVQDQARQLEEAQKQIDQAQENYNVAQQQYEAGGIDFPSLLSAKRALESVQNNYGVVFDSTSRAIEAAKTAIELDRYKASDSSSKDALSELREQLADCEIKAPANGVVTAVNVSVGDINTAKNTLITIEDNSSLKLVATVSESDILKLEEGMKAVVTAGATGDEEIPGKVSRVVRVKNQSGSNGGQDGASSGYSIEITVDNNKLLVGMDAKAKVMITEKGDVLAIPYDLIRYDDSGKSYVLVAEGNNDGTATAVRKNIEVGKGEDYYKEVIGGELKEGDKLIYDVMQTIVEGQTFAPEQMYSDQSFGTVDSSVGVEDVVQ